MRINFNEEELLDAFEFLDNLRESGVTNMWGSPDFVGKRFKWNDDKAGKAFLLWKNTLAARGDMSPMDNRVMAALELVAHEG